MTKTKIGYKIQTQVRERRFDKMISTLHIKNIGIINDLSIDFNNGFNVLTGETGAGKTLIIDSLRNHFRRKIFKRNDKKRRKLLIYRIRFVFTRA